MNKPKMKQHPRRFSALAVIGAFTVGALFALPTANADTQVNATGSYTDHQYVTSCTTSQHDLYEIDTYTIRITFTGTFTGVLEGTEVDVNYPSNGYFTAQGDGTFTGSVAGRSGTVHMTYLDAGPPPAHGQIANMWMVSAGTGDLEGLAGQGIFQHVVVTGYTPNPDCPYGPTLDFAGKVSGQLQFAQ